MTGIENLESTAEGTWEKPFTLPRDKELVSIGTYFTYGNGFYKAKEVTYSEKMLTRSEKAKWIFYKATLTIKCVSSDGEGNAKENKKHTFVFYFERKEERYPEDRQSGTT